MKKNQLYVFFWVKHKYDWDEQKKDWILGTGRVSQMLGSDGLQKLDMRWSRDTMQWHAVEWCQRSHLQAQGCVGYSIGYWPSYGTHDSDDELAQRFVPLTIIEEVR